MILFVKKLHVIFVGIKLIIKQMASTEAVFKSLRKDFKRHLAQSQDRLEDFEHKTGCDFDISLDSAKTTASNLST